MTRLRAPLATLMLLAGCAMVPTYHPPEGIPQDARTGPNGTGAPPRISDLTRRPRSGAAHPTLARSRLLPSPRSPPILASLVLVRACALS